MPLALTDDHRDLADSVAAWARRAAPTDATRAQFDDLAAGKRPESWDALVRQGLHAVHLPEGHGGAGAGLMELAVVTEQLGRTLHPGPFLATALAGGALTAAPASPLRGVLLERLAEGATAALADGPGITAEAYEGGWRLSGTSLPVLGLPGAEIVVVRAVTEAGEPVWCAFTPEAGEVRVEPGTDLTRPVGRLVLDGRSATTDETGETGEVLPGPAEDRVELLTATLLAADAAGVARWCVDTIVEYASTREQFGVPVGSFQAVQHKIALMLVKAEMIVAAAWDAARAADDTAADTTDSTTDGTTDTTAAAQRRLAAAQVGLTALPAAIDVAGEAVLLFGGIGFTWEHDAHLYWRRAISLAAVFGDESRWAARLGDLALDAERDFGFVGDDELPELRAELAEILDAALALPADDVPTSGWTAGRGGPRQEHLAAARLVAPHYPEPWGRSAGPAEQAVIAQEFGRRALTQPSTVIGEWVLPTLLVHGTPAQQERFVAQTLRGEILWCQLFSEPGAGSDLAALSTRARKVEGGWIISGQKVWNSMAAEADWGVCLARTDPDAAKHAGISYFLVDMRSAGIDVRPLRQATGNSEFNEVFLDDVFVPDECLVAEPNAGWRIAVTTLSNERLSMGARLSHGSSDLVRSLLGSGEHEAGRDAVVELLGRCVGREMALSALNLRSVLARIDGLDLGAEISVQKVCNAIAQRDSSRDLIRVLGRHALVAVPPEGKHSTDPVIDHLGLPAVLVGGGTLEIQLNVIARRVLRLPR